MRRSCPEVLKREAQLVPFITGMKLSGTLFVMTNDSLENEPKRMKFDSIDGQLLLLGRYCTCQHKYTPCTAESSPSGVQVDQKEIFIGSTVKSLVLGGRRYG